MPSLIWSEPPVLGNTYNIVKCRFLSDKEKNSTLFDLRDQKGLQTKTTASVLQNDTCSLSGRVLINLFNCRAETEGFEPSCPGGQTHFECAPL